MLFETVTPEECGVRSEDILSFIDCLCAAEPDQESHALLLIRHGKLLAEGYFSPYRQDMAHNLFSISKTFTSTAVGFAMSEGYFGLDDSLGTLIPMPDGAAEGAANITIRNLLTMSTGHAGEPVHAGGASRYDIEDWATAFLQQELKWPSGTMFQYNGFASYMLSYLIYQKTGQNLIDYLKPRLFDPLEIPVPFYSIDAKGIFIGFSSMRLTARDLAKMGQLYLQNGVWKGKQLLPKGWVALATQRHIDTSHVTTGEDWNQGYCFHFWRGRHNTFRFCGAFGQMCVVMPDYDAIFVTQSGFDNDKIKYILECFYDKILSRMQDGPCQPNPEAYDMLQRRLKNLSLLERYSTVSPLADRINGQEFRLEPNKLYDSVSFAFTDNTCHVTLFGGQNLVFEAGLKAPCLSESTHSHLVAIEKEDFATLSATAYWSDPHTFVVTARLLPTQTILRVTVDIKANTAAAQTIRGNL